MSSNFVSDMGTNASSTLLLSAKFFQFCNKNLGVDPSALRSICRERNPHRVWLYKAFLCVKREG